MSTPTTPIEIRNLIIHLYENGLSHTQIAKQTNKARTTVRDIVKRYQTTGIITPEKPPGIKKKLLSLMTAFYFAW